MTKGRLIAVVGPSGVGKDSIMQGLHQVMPKLHLVRRVITRAPDLGGEDYDAVSVAEFHEMAQNGAFALHWEAHGLHYGIPHTTIYQLNLGTDCLANLSRGVLQQAAFTFPEFLVLNVTADPETLAMRLAARGRETKDEIANRLAKAVKPLPPELNVINLPNNGSLNQAIGLAMALLQPVRG